MFEGLIPRLRVRTVYDIDLTLLKSKGLKGIITDLDNTLVGAKDPLATPQLAAWLEEVKRQGFKLVIVSNNDLTRVSNFATPLDIQFVHAARKPSQRPFHKAMKLMDLSPKETAVVGDQMLTDVLGGNRMQMFTILVQPIAIQDEGWTTRINRRIERIVTASLRKKGLWHEEEHQ
ncbi:YqeG family HAD IIIA-type phosphatase [Paenibacillus sp. ACRRX]|uniref:YqeG family HAD IIIA-type phosphatase n=1 Tax=unclassified Paenibacillus TaxID=185978 RepID=UPI001EF50609|nr:MULTISPECIES: YqeG family HAD IIIA-type phosphatase [unclassified Paenibacillus]MCG7407904.1 YqeG family HAD IIIA-type phosphatase [Paenibacillus sp. ACRRX]MDK8181047.1 YqeG family HAD IIIA-type phosphatase [Paenibacillus sp. UMB4589-SE434]